MTFRLAPPALAAGHGLIAFPSIGSTNRAAIEAAWAGETGPAWFATARQTAGEGRRGAAWEMPEGNLAATHLVTTDLPPATLAQLGFVAGVAVLEALESVAGQASHTGANRLFSLKWPNDVLAGDAKLVGILLAAEEIRPGHRAVAVGAGVNVVGSPDLPGRRTASLHGLGLDVSAEALFLELSASWVQAFAEWDFGRGFAVIRERWLAHAAGLGGPIAVTFGDRVVQGTFETLDPNGQLVVRDQDGVGRTVSAGDVHLGPARTVKPEMAA